MLLSGFPPKYDLQKQANIEGVYWPIRSAMNMVRPLKLEVYTQI